MTTTNCLCNGHGGIYGSSATYATARTTSTALYSNDRYYVGQVLNTEVYYVYRYFLKFDTSVIPDGDTITQVNMKLVTLEDSSNNDFDIVIKKADWSPYDPADADNRESIYDLILSAGADDNIWRNTNGISINTQYTSGNLSVAWVNKSGSSYYGLLSSRDISATPPTAGSGASEVERIASQSHATVAYRPILTIVHTPGGGEPVSVSPFFNFFKNFENPWKKKGGIWQPQNKGLVTI